MSTDNGVQELSLSDVLSQTGDQAQQTYENSGFKLPPAGDFDLALISVKPGIATNNKTGVKSAKLSLKFIFTKAPPEILDEYPAGFFHTLRSSNFSDNTTLQKFARLLDPTGVNRYAEDAQCLHDNGPKKVFTVRVSLRADKDDPSKMWPSLEPLQLVGKIA